MLRPNAVLVVMSPSMIVVPLPSIVHVRLAVIVLAVTPPKVSVLPAAMLLVVVDGLLVRPGPEQVEVTFTEGTRIEEMAEVLEEAGIGFAEDFIFAAQNAQLPPGLAAELPPAETLPENQRLQGYLFPDTYFVAVDSTPAELVRRMIDTMNDRFDADLRERAAAKGLTTHEVLTLASIVEGEARADEERETIAGVYHNRLRIGMALQADPTVQYAIALKTGQRKPRLYVKDYQFPSPYNTYLHPGLPPGPVNSPSRRSIEAALYPAKVPYLYFVAESDVRPDSSASAPKPYTYTKPGFYSDPELSEKGKVSEKVINGIDDQEHEKYRLPTGESTLFMQDDEGRVYEVRFTVPEGADPTEIVAEVIEQ